MSHAPLRHSLALLGLSTIATAQSPPDFSQRYEMAPALWNFRATPVSSKVVVAATATTNPSAVILTIHDEFGVVQGSYRYEFPAVAIATPGLELLPVDSGGTERVVIAGTCVGTGDLDTDLWALEVELPSGAIVWSGVFGTEHVDRLGCIERGKNELVSTAPGQISVVPTYYFVSQMERRATSDLTRQVATLVTHTDHMGQVLSAVDFTDPLRTAHRAGDLFVDSSVSVDGRITLAGARDDRLQGQSLERTLLTISFDVSDPTSPLARRHAFAGIELETGRRRRIVRGFGDSGLPEHAIGSTLEGGTIALVGLEDESAVWAEQYVRAEGLVHLTDLASDPGGLAMAIGEHEQGTWNPQRPALATMDAGGHLASLVAFDDPVSVQPSTLDYWNGGLLLQSGPLHPTVAGGHRLTGLDASGFGSRSCPSETTLESRALECATTDHELLIDRPDVHTGPLALERGVECGNSILCDGEWEYWFCGESRHYGSLGVPD